MRSKIISEGQRMFCGGVEREQIFKQCILPVLQTLSEGQNINMIDLISKVISHLHMMKGLEDVEMVAEGNDQGLARSLETLKATSLQANFKPIGMSDMGQQQQILQQPQQPMIIQPPQDALQQQLSNDQIEQMILQQIEQNKDKLSQGEINELLSNLVQIKTNNNLQ